MSSIWRDSTGPRSTIQPTAGNWHLIEIQLLADTIFRLYVDGQLAYEADPVNQPGEIQGLLVGQRNGTVENDNIVYIDQVLVGTAQGLDDIFSDDFESGDLSAWTSVTGDATVVANPAGLPVIGGSNYVLKADLTSVSDSYVHKNLPGTDAEVWVTLYAGFEQAALDIWESDPDLWSGEFATTLFTSQSIPDTIGLAPVIAFSEDEGPPSVYEPPLWRFVVTDLDLAIVTILTPLAANRRATFTLDAPAMATGVVPSDSPEVNILQSGHPFLDEGRRCLLGFRREGGDPPWVIRFAGILEQIEDQVDEDGEPTGHSTYTAWDPWKLLYSRPCLRPDGTLPAQGGLVFNDTPANEIATVLLDRVLTYTGEHHIKTGNIETCPNMDIAFQQGTSVGEAWQQLCESGFLDINLRPIYDPINSPGKLVALGIAPLWGRDRHKAIFSWDMPMRSLTGITRLKDGTQRANKVQLYTAQGGPAVGLESDFTSVSVFGEYWLQKFLPGQIKTAVPLFAETELLLLADGLTTYTVRPLPETSPRPFIDYGLGDQCPVLASSNLREKIAVTQRVYEIPIEIDDNGTEHVSELTFAQDNLT